MVVGAVLVVDVVLNGAASSRSPLEGEHETAKRESARKQAGAKRFTPDYRQVPALPKPNGLCLKTSGNPAGTGNRTGGRLSEVKQECERHGGERERRCHEDRDAVQVLLDHGRPC